MSTADLDLLYRRCAARLTELVRREVSAPDAVVEDACQIAWGRLLRNPGVAGEHAFGWLLTTARREARRLAMRAQRDLPLEEWSLGSAVVEGPEHTVPERWAAQALSAVTPRQRRLLWLQALGCTHEEIARLSGCSERTVHRQIVRARARLRAAADPD